MCSWDEFMFGNERNRCCRRNQRGGRRDDRRGERGVQFICECREVRGSHHDHDHHHHGCGRRRCRREW